MIIAEDISMEFKSPLSNKKQKVLSAVSFGVEQGDCLGVLGESGSGKSTLGKIMTGLLKPTSGKYLFEGKAVYEGKANRQYLSRKISVVFQDYTTSVNPRFTVAEILKEPLTLISKKNKHKVDYDKKVKELLNIVDLDGGLATRFPHQLSGGQLQRVCIARAIAVKPQMILFDEAISSLDAHTHVQIMELLKKLKSDLSLTYLFITHDLTSVTYLCNKVMFLHQGEITELIDVQDISKTQDVYAKKLLDSIISF